MRTCWTHIEKRLLHHVYPKTPGDGDSGLGPAESSSRQTDSDSDSGCTPAHTHTTQTSKHPSKNNGLGMELQKTNRFRLLPRTPWPASRLESPSAASSSPWSAWSDCSESSSPWSSASGSGPSPCSESERSGALSSGLASSPLAVDAILFWDEFWSGQKQKLFLPSQPASSGWPSKSSSSSTSSTCVERIGKIA